MNVKRPFTALMSLVLLMSFAAGPAAAVTSFAPAQEECTQANSQGNLANVNVDPNVNAGNIALNIPVLSPNTGDGDQYAEANQAIADSGDSFQEQTNVC